MQVKEEAHGVFSTQLYDQRICNDVVDHLKQLDRWAAAQVVATGADGRAMPATLLDVRTASILYEPYALELCKDFEAKMGGLMLHLIKELWRVEFKLHSEVQIIRYSPGGYYKAHSDYGLFTNERFFTVLCYINDNFEGGGTYFPSLGYCAKPRCGHAIIFPARYVHCAEPVLSGEKYIIMSWVIGPAPIDWI